MAQLGRIARTFLDNQGRPIVGLNVTVRKQGATVNGLHAGAQTSFTINDPGGITSSPQDQLQVGTDTSVTRSVSSVAATTIIVGATGFSDVPDDARLTPTTNLPTVYNDAQGAETITQPMQTDANGEILCWASIVPYDLYTPGNTSYAARLIQDVVPEGQEYVVSNIFPSATSVAFRKNTSRAQISGSKLESWLSNDIEKFYLDLDASLNPRLPGHSIAGTLKFTPAVSKIVPGATSLAFRNNADSADNLLISDAGTATVRAALAVGTTLSVTGNVLTDLTLQDKVINLTDSTPTTRLILDGSSGGAPLIGAVGQLLNIQTSLAQGSKASGAIQFRNTTDLDATDKALAVLIGAGIVFAIGGTNYRLYLNGVGASHGEVMAGFGTPEAAVTAPVGSLYLRADGGAVTTLYIKESGTGNTGWVAK